MAERASERRRAVPVAEPDAGRDDWSAPAQLLCTSPRAVFADLMGGALKALGTHPSPPAVAYLIGLLELHICRPEVHSPERSGAPMLADALALANSEKGGVEASRLRDLGDRALFVSGFFGESLAGCVAGPRYYEDVGRMAYCRLSSRLARAAGDFGPRELFEELADEFGAFAELLAEVAARTRAERPPAPSAPFLPPDRQVKLDLLATYDRYLRTGSLKDRDLLLRNGVVPPPPEALRRLQ